MRIKIEAQSQGEFEEKREALVKTLAGSVFDVSLRPKSKSRYDRERPATEPRNPYFKAQAEMLAYFDQNFSRMLEELKREIREVLKEGSNEP